MSEPWWKRRKKKGPWFNDIQEELERLGDLIDETIQKAFETSSEKALVHRTRAQGFSMKIGLDGKLRIREFNNHKPQQKEPEISEGAEPLVDLIEEAETIVVLASLPGVKKDAIDLRVTENRLRFSVDTPTLECYKELRLPARVDPKSARASYKNGVLEVKLKKIRKLVKDDRISVKK